MKRFDARTQQGIAWGLLGLIMLIYAVEMSHQTVLRYDTFKATAFDLGNLDQVIWNTLHGRPFQYSNQAIDWYGPPTRLAQHFEPILLPLSLLYVVHADPRILLVFQTLVLTTGALPVFLLTRKFLPEWPLLAALMAGAYLLSPAMLGLNIFDFHPVSLAVPLLLYAILALTYKRYGWFLITCFLAGMCKEEIPLVIALFGLLVIWKYKLPRLGTVLVIGGVAWSALAFFVIIPHFYPGVQHNNFWYRYEQLGSSPGAAVINLLIHPWLLFSTLITLDRIYYLAGLFRTTGFSAFLAPEWLLPTLPTLAINLATNDPSLYSGVYHYNAALIPFIILAAIHGTRRLLLCWYGWREEQPITAPALQVSRGGGGWDAGWGPLWSPVVGDNGISFIIVARQVIGAIVALCKTALDFWRERLLYRLQRVLQWEHFNARMVPLAKNIAAPRLQWIMFAWITLMLGLNFVLATPLLNGFWADHEPGSHEQHIEQLLAMIPADASVSAGANLNPHLSERQLITVFPSITFPSNHSVLTVQYVIVDLDSVFPEDRATIASKLNQLVISKQFRIVAQAEGVWLLVHSSI